MVLLVQQLTEMFDAQTAKVLKFMSREDLAAVWSLCECGQLGVDIAIHTDTYDDVLCVSLDKPNDAEMAKFSSGNVKGAILGVIRRSRASPNADSVVMDDVISCLRTDPDSLCLAVAMANRQNGAANGRSRPWRRRGIKLPPSIVAPDVTNEFLASKLAVCGTPVLLWSNRFQGSVLAQGLTADIEGDSIHISNMANRLGSE